VDAGTPRATRETAETGFFVKRFYTPDQALSAFETMAKARSICCALTVCHETRRCVVSDLLTRWYDFEELWPGRARS
jgi:hypothetical protein